ncbi:MAG: hydratase [Synergistaceae bacterium]|nr:hydratase [Synergistaceae bacterium]
MIRLIKDGAYLLKGNVLIEYAGSLNGNGASSRGDMPLDRNKAAEGTICGKIIASHNEAGDGDSLNLRFDSLVSHDISYVGIIQTLLASGLKEFSVPYVLTNCHNSLCAVGGTINEDDHFFGLSAAKKFGGEYVPVHMAVIHQYMREMYAGCGKMILGSDSHTRYGALGTLGVGEGGPELVKQLLGKRYSMSPPEVAAVYLEGAPAPGVGPMDVALAIIGAVFKNDFVKNSVMEFVGPGISNLSVDFRIGIDVMMTETACWSSIWRTDGKVKDYLAIHGRHQDYKPLEPAETTYYSKVVAVDLSSVKPMIALPFHPSNVYEIDELNAGAPDILEPGLKSKFRNGRLRAEHGVIGGCAGGSFENIIAASQILEDRGTGNDKFRLSVYPASQPINIALSRNGSLERLMLSGATIHTAFCGPCFGAGETPANGSLSIRHNTRNFPNREGSRPEDGQMSYVALMDARSIASTAANGGALTPATDMPPILRETPYLFDRSIYEKRVYRGFRNPIAEEELIFGPNIKPWPKIDPLPANCLLLIASVINDPVTPTDDLIPSGETSSMRSNPLKLAEHTLSRKDPGYVKRAKYARNLEADRMNGKIPPELSKILSYAGSATVPETIGIGSVIFAVKPGDGSAREQAASSQKMLGGMANLALAYATKRYCDNLINWGMLPIIVDPAIQPLIELEGWLCLPDIRSALEDGKEEIHALLISADGTKKNSASLKLPPLSREERDIILSGCLMNYYARSDKYGQ